MRNQIIYMLIKLGMKQIDIANGLSVSKQLINTIYHRCERKYNSAVKYRNISKQHTTNKSFNLSKG